MEQIIKKYIQRIKIDFPEDDKLYMDLQEFLKEVDQFRQAAVSGSLPCQHEWVWNHAMGKHYCKCGAEMQ